jgi:hypothetical protein
MEFIEIKNTVNEIKLNGLLKSNYKEDRKLDRLENKSKVIVHNTGWHEKERNVRGKKA